MPINTGKSKSFHVILGQSRCQSLCISLGRRVHRAALRVRFTVNNGPVTYSEGRGTRLELTQITIKVFFFSC